MIGILNFRGNREKFNILLPIFFHNLNNNELSIINASFDFVIEFDVFVGSILLRFEMYLLLLNEVHRWSNKHRWRSCNDVDECDLRQI